MDYQANTNAWVTSVEIKNYINNLEKERKSQRRKIELVIGNAPSHEIFELNEVELIFLSQNLDIHRLNLNLKGYSLCTKIKYYDFINRNLIYFNNLE